jgi:hypothetical protein
MAKVTMRYLCSRMFPTSLMHEKCPPIIARIFPAGNPFWLLPLLFLSAAIGISRLFLQRPRVSTADNVAGNCSMVTITLSVFASSWALLLVEKFRLRAHTL